MIYLIKSNTLNVSRVFVEEVKRIKASSYKYFLKYKMIRNTHEQLIQQRILGGEYFEFQ